MKGSFPVLLAAALLSAGGSPGVRAEKPLTPEDRSHWAFVPPTRPALPALEGHEQTATHAESGGEGIPVAALGGIDRFLLARLRREGLDFAPEADRRTLIRRLTLDLTGLPPSPEEVEAFVRDTSSDAYEKLTDRLLASPAYGERQAQPWLDVARFAESDGFELDIIRPEAWRYRDWVIAALNADMPYDRFLQLQLAADELAPEDPAAQAATGFLMAGPDMPDINLPEERRHQFLNGMTAAVGEACLGLTLGCAQCHDHKTDPVSIDDFYRLRAVFANTVTDPRRDEQLGTVAREHGPSAPVEFVRIRGDFRRPGAETPPGFPRVLNAVGAAVPAPPADARSSQRRAAFARWLTRPEHPLAARVMVNRLWQQHFGRGLVVTPGDFGRTGSRPSHPELLDWLAVELPARGWSLKAMHRLMVTSRAWRQASRGQGPEWALALACDPANELISRMPPHRLEGEAVRDFFLSVSGLLNRQGGGPGVRPPLPAEITDTLLKHQWDVTPDIPAHHRRSIYLFARRNLRFPLFEVFDRPDSNMPCSRRDHSTTAIQSLTLLNSQFSLETAQALAARVTSDKTTGPVQWIDNLHAILFSRPPQEPELRLGLDFLAAHPGPEGLTHYCLALLNTNEAITVD
ncbi:MAG: hypothetical protein JWM59_4281 [Verrucomicrobiales bacterium]|nr:hypothetical protein [Verrucomicrobiales bacterium]